jgi:hypothetical protein
MRWAIGIEQVGKHHPGDEWQQDFPQQGDRGHEHQEECDPEYDRPVEAHHPLAPY